MNAIQIAAKLYECRDTMRSFLGAHYARDMALYATAIRGLAKADKSTELAAAQKMAGEMGGFGAIAVLAAYVEMEDPAPPASPAPGTTSTP